MATQSDTRDIGDTQSDISDTRDMSHDMVGDTRDINAIINRCFLLINDIRRHNGILNKIENLVVERDLLSLSLLLRDIKRQCVYRSTRPNRIATRRKKSITRMTVTGAQALTVLQRKVLEQIEKNGRVNNREIAKSISNVTMRSVQRCVKFLLEKGFIKK